MIESMAGHVAAGDARYDTIHVFYLDDRDDLLNHVGLEVGVADNAKLQRKLQGKANRLSFSCVRSEWKEKENEAQVEKYPSELLM